MNRGESWLFSGALHAVVLLGILVGGVEVSIPDADGGREGKDWDLQCISYPLPWTVDCFTLTVYDATVETIPRCAGKRCPGPDCEFCVRGFELGFPCSLCRPPRKSTVIYRGPKTHY